MTEENYELTDEKRDYYGHTLYRIRALKDFNDVKKGDLGGFVERTYNLSQLGNCWIYNDAMVMDDGHVGGDARIYDAAVISEHGKVVDNATVGGMARIMGNGKVVEFAHVVGGAIINDLGVVSGHALVTGHAHIRDKSMVTNNAKIFDNVQIKHQAYVGGSVNVYEKTVIDGMTCILGDAIINSEQDFQSFERFWTDAKPHMTYTTSNDKWTIGTKFHGTSEEFIAFGYQQSETDGKRYEKYVNFVKEIHSIVDNSN